jgi:hypothetical protein
VGPENPPVFLPTPNVVGALRLPLLLTWQSGCPN